MTPSEVLKAECTLALSRCLEADPAVLDPYTLACGMFFAGVDAQNRKPRAMAEVEAEILLVRSRVSGASNAKHRPRTDHPAPSRRASDAADPTLAADLEAEAGRARDRDRRQRIYANEHPTE